MFVSGAFWLKPNPPVVVVELASDPFCPKVKPPVVAGCPKLNGVPAFSAGFASVLVANGLGDDVGPKLKGAGLFCVGWLNGEDVPPKPPLNFDSSGFLGVSTVILLIGLSSIITSESSFFGGVTVLVAAGVPFAVEPNSAEFVVGAGVEVVAPKPNLFSLLGVEGAVPVNVNGDFAGSGPDGVDG